MHNYASETLHLTACLTQLWSERIVKFWMDNSLINPSGKKEGFIVCDYLDEYVIRKVKNMLQFNINESTLDFLYKTNASQIILFQAVQEMMIQETDAPNYGAHSSHVNVSSNIEHIANVVLRYAIADFHPGCRSMQRSHPRSTDPATSSSRHETTSSVGTPGPSWKLKNEPPNNLHGIGLRVLGSRKPIRTYVDKLDISGGVLSSELDEQEDNGDNGDEIDP